jgi:site-specific recombinase XerD
MEDQIADYLLDLEVAGRCPATIERYRPVLRRLAVCLRRQRVKKFSRAKAPHLRACLRELQAAGLKPRTVQTMATVMSGFFEWLVIQGTASDNPMARIRRPKSPQRRVAIFTTEELLRLLEAARRTRDPIRNTAMFYILLDCGLRASELLSVKPSDYDAETGRLIVNGKGSKVRMLHMGIRCRQAFESQLARANGDLWGIGRMELGKLIRNMGQRTGVRAYPHKFRHTFACSFLEAGGTQEELQYLLGHSSLLTTAIYTSATQEQRALRSHAAHSPGDALGVVATCTDARAVN